MRISLGPVPYHWPRAAMLAFYERAVASDADIVYVGETVCAKRRELSTEDWLEVAALLAAAGKEVVVSTLTLIEAASELGVVKRLCGQPHFAVEANDMGAVQMLAEQGRGFVAGAAINIYSGRSLAALVACGLRRWVVPVEIGRDAIARILAEWQALAPADALVETEVIGHGHLPLAWSARCFTARAADVPKDRCEFRCIGHPRGLPVHTRDGERVFTINGIQTQSGRICDLCELWPELDATGVDVFRVSPVSEASLDIVDTMAAAVREQRVPEATHWDEPACRGYWYGGAGMADGAGEP